MVLVQNRRNLTKFDDVEAVHHKLHVLILMDTSPRPETRIFDYFCYFLQKKRIFAPNSGVSRFLVLVNRTLKIILIKNQQNKLS